MMLSKDFVDGISKVEFTRPKMEYEGLAGYMETDVTVDIRDLAKFERAYRIAQNTNNPTWYHDVRKRLICEC